jgi:amino acid permease
MTLIFQTLFIAIPLSLRESLGNMRFYSLSMLLMFAYIATILIFEFPFYVSHYRPLEAYIEYAKYDLDSFLSFFIFLFGYLFINGIVETMAELRNPSFSRMMKVIKRSIMIEFACFTTFGFFGYLSTKNFTPEILLFRETLIQYDLFSYGAVLCAIICILFHIPLNYHSYKEKVNELFNIESRSAYSNY